LLDGSFFVTYPKICLPEVGMRIGAVRIQLQRPLVGFNGIPIPSQFQINTAEAVVRDWIVGVETERLLIVLLRFRVPPQVITVLTSSKTIDS